MIAVIRFDEIHSTSVSSKPSKSTTSRTTLRKVPATQRISLKTTVKPSTAARVTTPFTFSRTTPITTTKQEKGYFYTKPCR